jgi:cytosine/creatinine deaminase
LVQRIAASVSDLVSVEQVAFPQSGIVKAPGTHELLRKAARMEGVVAIGGVDPAGYDGDPHGQLRAIFEIADETGCKIDIHLHDPGTLGAWELELIAQYTKALGMQDRVTVSHAFALSTVDLAMQQRLIEILAEHKISIVTALPYDRPLLPTNMLREAGVALGMGNDNIDDLWSAFGSGDMLERAWLLAYRSEWRKDSLIRTALEVATQGSASVLQLDRYGVSPGCKADLVIARARTPGELVVKRPRQRWVIKDGVVIRRPSPD